MPPQKNNLPHLTLALIACVGLVWLNAQENTATPETPIPSDKWAQIQANQKGMMKSLDELDENLNFIRIRVMQGGRRTP